MSLESAAARHKALAGVSHDTRTHIPAVAWGTRAFSCDANNDNAQIVNIIPLLIRLIDAIGDGRDAGALAWMFHQEFAHVWANVAEEAAIRTGISTVVLAGGVFCNGLLTHLLTEELTIRGLRVLRAKRLPPNDGAIAFGQSAIAAARMRAGMVC